MSTTTQPTSRFGWQGQTLEYVVKVDEAAELVPADAGTDGIAVRVKDVTKIGDGLEARVAVDVVGPVFYRDAVSLQARSASGAVREVPMGLMAVPNCMIGGLGIIGALALVGAVFAIRWGGWAGWTLGIIAALIAIAGVGFVGFGMWGRYVGFPWGFAS